MNKPKISVIIPAYNVEKYIQKSLISVLNQTYQNLEVIVINDGSTDLTKDYVEKMANTDSRVRVINTENKGVSHARNFGLDAASGEYIGFVDSDDWISDLMYEKMIESAIYTNADIVMCDFFVTTDKKVNYIHKNNQKESVYVTDVDTSFIDNILLLPPSTWNKLYKKEIFKEIRFPEGLIFEDFMVYSKLVLSANIISFVNEPLYYYFHKRFGSIMNNKNDSFYEQIINQHVEKYKDILVLNRPFVSKVFYLRLHKNYFMTKKRIRKKFYYVKTIITKDKKKYKFTLKEVILMNVHKHLILRPFYKVYQMIILPFKR